MGKQVPEIHTVYVFNSYFFEATLVSVVSAILNNPDCKLNIHLLSFKGNEKLGGKIRAEIEAHGIAAFEHYVNHSFLRDFSVGNFKNKRNAASQKIDKTIFLKLFIPNIIEKPNILYIDSDTIVGSCLKTLYELHLRTPKNLVVEDRSSKKRLADNYLSQFHLTNYFNSGVMYLNLELLREKNFFEQALNLEKIIGKLKNLADQDLFNVILKNDNQFVDKKYNVQTNAKNAEHDITKELESFPNSILHFIGPTKPWHIWSSDAHKRIWIYYASKVKTEKIMLQKPQKLLEFVQLSQRYYVNGDYQNCSILSSKIIEKLLRKSQ